MATGNPLTVNENTPASYFFIGSSRKDTGGAARDGNRAPMYMMSYVDNFSEGGGWF